MMSDFSIGFFTINKHKEKIYPHLTEDDLLIQYNEKWVGKLSAMDWKKQPQLQNLALSKEMPLLYVVNAEDHDFIMNILYEEEIKFHFHISYEVGMDLYTEIGAKMYGNYWWLDEDLDESTRDERDKQIRKEWAKQMEQQGLLDRYFSNASLESLKAFKLFDISEENILKLNEILTIKNCAKGSHSMVYDLLDCLGLEGFAFVSFDYASDGNDDRFTILNP